MTYCSDSHAGGKLKVFAGISHTLLAAWLLAASSSHALAQQQDGGAPVRARPLAPQKNDLRQLAGGTAFRDCAACPEIVVIPPGRVSPDAPDNEPARAGGEEAPHSIALEHAIGVGKYEVTKAQFARFVRESGHAINAGCFVWGGGRYGQDASKSWRNPGFKQTEREPVVCINRSDAKAYTEWLTQKTGKTYRLPTELEWEYAARAGDRSARPWGDNAGDACRYANVADASAKRGVAGTASWTFHECDDKHAYTAPVGSYAANAFGLHDMLGNAWEWMEDCWREENAAAASKDSGPDAECGRRMLRGGAWVDSPAFVRYDFRFIIGPDDRDFYMGFRVVRTD